MSGAARFVAFRLRPGEDLRQAIVARFEGLPEQAGFIASAVGSLDAAIRRELDDVVCPSRDHRQPRCRITLRAVRSQEA